MATTNIYILKLEGNRYYIGYTSDPKKRINEHLNGNGCSFTKKYKPIAVEKIKYDEDPIKVDKYVIKYMQKFGINNVRGGTYKDEKLSDDLKLKLKKELDNDPKMIIEVKNMMSTIKPKTNKPIKIKINKTITKIHKGTCYICGRDGHYQEDCNYSNESENELGNEPVPVGNGLLVNNFDEVYGISKKMNELSEIDLPDDLNNNLSFDYKNDKQNSFGFKY
jgi:predicted GIY-YIG superfamily endonuclease